MFRSWTVRLCAVGVGLVALALAAFGGVTLASHQFPDVPTGHQYHDDVAWLVDNGITTGFLDGTYRPNSYVTRGQMAAFLHRMAEATKPNPVLVTANYSPSWNSDDTKSVFVLCPVGTKVTGGGASLTGFTSALVNVALQDSYPLSDLSGWAAQAHEINLTGSDWNLTVEAVCIKG